MPVRGTIVGQYEPSRILQVIVKLPIGGIDLLEPLFQREGGAGKRDGAIRMGLQGLLPVDGLESRHLEITNKINGHAGVWSEKDIAGVKQLRCTQFRSHQPLSSLLPCKRYR